MRAKAASWIVSLVLISTVLSAQEEPSDQERYDEYHAQLREQFKQESWWYRTWHRYEINPGFSKYSIGPAMVNPLLNWENTHDNFALRYRQSHLEFGAAFWKGQTDSESPVETFNRFSIGYFTPYSGFSLGNRQLDVKGMLLQPAWSFGYTLTDKNHGAYFAPGFHVQLPFFLVAARANIEYTFGGGFNVFPEVSLQLDALRGLLNPQKVKTGKYNSSMTTATPLGGGWYEVRSSYSSSDFYIQDVGPFWGLTPRFGFALSDWTETPYQTYGLGLSGRISFVGADIHVDRGTVVTGVVSNVNDLDGTVRNEFDNDQVLGTVNTTEFTFEGNVSIVGLYLSIFKKNAIREMGNTTTPLNRLNFHLGLTRFVPGKATYQNEDVARTYTDQFFADHPEVERNAINDPLQHESNWGVTYGMSYEMGAVGVRVNNKLTKTMGRGSTLEVYYILPVSKIMRVYKN